MAEPSPLDEWVDCIDEMAVAVADATMREVGMVQPPVVHVLVEGQRPPYLGYLTCRPFRRGADAAAAITVLGVLPAALGASRLVITWEHADMCAALETPGAGSAESAVVVVDADRGGHQVWWHPMRMRGGGIGALGAPTVEPLWGPVRSFSGDALPAPVVGLLAVWRSPRPWTDAQATHAYRDLEAAGYEMRWLQTSGDKQ